MSYAGRIVFQCDNCQHIVTVPCTVDVERCAKCKCTDMRTLFEISDTNNDRISHHFIRDGSVISATKPIAIHDDLTGYTSPNVLTVVYSLMDAISAKYGTVHRLFSNNPQLPKTLREKMLAEDYDNISLRELCLLTDTLGELTFM